MTAAQKEKKRPARSKPAASRDGIPPEIARMMLVSLVNAGRLDDAERLLNVPHLANQADGLRFELGMAYAAQGRLEQALGHFQALRQREPNDARARQAILDVLQAQASEHATRQEWEDAAQALTAALKIAPDDRQLGNYLAAIQEALPARYISQGQYEQASAIWERTQAADPTSYQVAHNLAILYHRWAIEQEQAGSSATRRPLDLIWRRAIANWALVVAADSFWETWVAGKQAIYGMPIEQAKVDELRKSGLRERLELIHRDFEAAYQRSNNQQAAEQHAEYRLLLRLEFKTAQAMRETTGMLRQHGKAVEVPICAGPLMLSQLGKLDGARHMAQQAQKQSREFAQAHILEAYLSSLGRYYLLVDEGQTDRAILELKPIISREPTNGEARGLIVRALNEAGHSLLANDVEQAIATWADALQYEPENAEIKDLIAQHCLKRAAELSQANDRDGTIRVLNTGLRHAPNHRGIKERLASELNSRGVSYANRKEWNLAIADLEQAHKLAPGNQQISANLEQVRGAQRMGPLLQIVELIQGGRYDAAIAQLTPLVQREPRNSEARELLGYAHYQRAAAHNNRGDWSAAIMDLEQALRHEPNNQRYLDDLAVVRKSKAFALLQNNQSTDAIELLMVVLERNPRDAEAAIMMAGACNVEGVRLANEAVVAAQYDRGNACQQLRDAEALLTIGLQYALGNKMLIENRNRVNNLRRQIRC